MLVLKLEIWPFGNEEEKREIGQLKIINTLSNDRRPKFGDYTILFEDKEYNNIVKNHKRNDGAWKLVGKALYNLFCKRR